MPITEWKDRYAVAPWFVRVEPNAENGLDKMSAADAFQVRSVAQERFVKRVGALSEDTMQEIAEALAIVLRLGR